MSRSFAGVVCIAMGPTTAGALRRAGAAAQVADGFEGITGLLDRSHV